MKTRILLLIAFFSASCLAAEPEQSELEVRDYQVLPSAESKIDGSEFGNEKSGTTSWKEFFKEMGLEWPEGSSVKYSPSRGLLIVKNTEKNLDLFQEILVGCAMVPYQVEVRMDFIEYKMEDIEKLAREDALSSQDLLDLWKKGKGKLLYTPSAIGLAGHATEIRAVTEYIYPTDFEVNTSSTTNAAGLSVISGVVEPSAFETRQVGVILGFTAQISSCGSVIDLSLTPETVYKPKWKDYGGSSKDGEARKDLPGMEQPFFHTHTLATRVSVKDGATVRIGGGMNNRTGDKTVFAFLTATLLDLEGNPISKKEKRDED